jgi:hypothetical protein
MCPICRFAECPGKGYPLMWERFAAGRDVEHWRAIHDGLNGLAAVPPAFAARPSVAEMMDRLEQIRACPEFSRPSDCGCVFGRCARSGKPTTYHECDRCLE